MRECLYACVFFEKIFLRMLPDTDDTCLPTPNTTSITLLYTRVCEREKENERTT